MTAATVRLQAALQQAVQSLQNAEVDEARLDAELLLAHTLDLDRAAILAQPDRPLTPKELTRFRDLVARRVAREPLPYITGHREFFGLDLVVDARVLIPRPETELLIEHALRLDAARCGGRVRIFDFAEDPRAGLVIARAFVSKR